MLNHPLLKTLLVAVPMALAGVALQARDADACGGCFVPPEESTVVTGHRMILSVGMTQTTLYDQIEYSGDPAEFAWVLPIVGTVDVGTSSDLVFNQLGIDTGVEVLPPVLDCPAIYCDNSAQEGDDFGSTGSGGGGGATNGGGVEVLAEEVVGPYQTVQLAAEDPNALNQWLDENGYNVPAEIQPIINAYVNDGFNFLAMKLIPGAGIERMQPVRITTAGSNAVLPLRMVAAGTGANTTMTLWIVGEGRYEPSNFPSFVIDAANVVWDYDNSESNYKALRQSAYDASQGFGWLVESASAYSADGFRNSILNVVDFSPDQSGYAGEDPLDYETARANAEADLAALFGGITGPAYVTRLRGELSRAALGTDLLVGASDVQAGVDRVVQTVAFEGTQPACPSPPPGCWYYDSDGNGDGDGNGNSDDGGSCTLTTPRSDGPAFGGLALLGCAMVLVRRRRRR